MTNRLPTTDWLHWPETEQLVAAFTQAEFPLRFVGGAVRDALLGRPVMDIDAATPASPQKVMAILEQAGIKAVPTGLSHGTITAVVGTGKKIGRHFEITTLRRDIKTFGRHAEVLFTHDWQEDAARRDFTMNALYADPDGTVYDYFSGVKDALTGQIRFIGDPQKRIQEDALRILRFFRFYAAYGEAGIDAAGLEACILEKQRIGQLSGERITQEMLKLLVAEKASEALAMMQEGGILAEVIPGMIDTHSLEAFSRVRLMADREMIDPLIPLALLLRSQNQQTTPMERLTQRWRLSAKQVAQLQVLTSIQAIDAQLTEAGQKALLRRIGAESFLALVLISWSERLSEQPTQPQVLSAAYRSMLGLPNRWQPPVFPVNGADLQKAGIAPGPQMGQWLAQLESLWEEEQYRPTREMLLEQLHIQMQGMPS